MWTLDGAYATFEEKIKGSITPGKLADFVVLQKDPRKVPPDTIKDIIVDATYLGGEKVYAAPANAVAMIPQPPLNYGDGTTATATKKKITVQSGNSSKLLFTPGPLTTSATVKGAMLRDLGLARQRFSCELCATFAERLLASGSYPPENYECILMQGSGTFVVESVISSAIPHDGKLLVLVNGAYGRRIGQMARVHGIDA